MYDLRKLAKVSVYCADVARLLEAAFVFHAVISIRGPETVLNAFDEGNFRNTSHIFRDIWEAPKGQRPCS